MPWDPDHVFYVWFDALLNYYTALGYARPGEDLTDRFWPATYHIIGKDILKFHTVFWPAMLMAARLPLPEHVFVHGFLLGADGRKMSKSLGNVLDPFEVIDEFGIDALRFYLMRDVAFGARRRRSAWTRSRPATSPSWPTTTATSPAASIAMIRRYRDGVVPDVATDPDLAGEFDGLCERVSALLDRAEVTAALEEIWTRVRRCNRYVEERAPWQLAKDPASAEALDRTLASLAEAVRVISVLLAAYIPESTAQAARRAGRSRHLDRRRRLRPHGRRPDRGRAGAAVSQAGRRSRAVIDSHTHLDFCEPPNAELVAAAEEAGVTRILTVGTDGASCRAALGAAEDFPQVYAAIGRHPNSATGFDDADFAELEALAAHEKCLAIGETGLDYYRDYAPASDQRRAFEAQIELARTTGKPLVIHTRAADDDTLAILTEQAQGLRVILHCFSMAERVEECLGHEDWFFSFAGNATYPRAEELRAAALRVPSDRLLVETDAPYLSPQPVRGKPNQPANVAMTAQALALERRVGYAELERAVDANAAALLGW